MLSLEMKSPLGPELFPCTHSSLTPRPLGTYKLVCSGSGLLASGLAPVKSKGQCEGHILPCVEGASVLPGEVPASSRPLALRPTGDLWEPGLCPKPHPSDSGAGKRAVGACAASGDLMHLTCHRTQISSVVHCPSEGDLLAYLLSEHREQFSAGPSSLPTCPSCLVGTGLSHICEHLQDPTLLVDTDPHTRPSGPPGGRW